MPERRVSTSVLVSIVSVALTAGMFWFTMKTEQRAAQLFGSQVRPLVQEHPTGVAFDPSLAFARTAFDLVNYSGFDAYDVSIDVKYATNGWNNEWFKAEVDRLQRMKSRTPEEEQRLKDYLTLPLRVARIRAGEAAIAQSTGSLSREYVCKNNEGIDVLARVIWKNERRQAFDRIRKFKLVCTRRDGGISFEFFPEGIVANYE